MGRVAQNKLKTLIVGVVAAVIIAGGAVVAVVANSPTHKTGASYNSQQQLTYLTYRGQDSVDALTLIKKHAQVGVKHYSFGDLVTSINGSQGNGPRYWTLYVNGKESNVGAGSYITKNSDKIEWKLQ
jgi:hypothetical protein